MHPSLFWSLLQISYFSPSFPPNFLPPSYPSPSPPGINLESVSGYIIWITTSGYLHINLALISPLVISILPALWSDLSMQLRWAEPADFGGGDAGHDVQGESHLTDRTSRERVCKATDTVRKYRGSCARRVPWTLLEDQRVSSAVLQHVVKNA